jgi:uncharacterized protein (DUF58 family)
VHAAFNEMSIPNRYLDAELVEQLNQLQLAARSVVEGTAAGLHRSRLKGASVEFRQHRAYVPGDEPRRLDWRVLARTNRPFVKEYDEETNLRCLIALDCSGSMAYGTDPAHRKFDYAARLVAALSYLMLWSTESVGLATMSQNLDTYLAPRGGSLQLSRVIDLLDRTRPADAPASAITAPTITAARTTPEPIAPAPSNNAPISIAPAIQQIAGRLGRRALVILISDFFSRPPDLRQALARLRHDRHELVCVRILHPDEQNFPFKIWSLFQGFEGERAYLGEPALMRRQYLTRFDQHSRELTTLCRSMSADLHTFNTDRPPIDTIRQFLKSRSRGGRR